MTVVVSSNDDFCVFAMGFSGNHQGPLTEFFADLSWKIATGFDKDSHVVLYVIKPSSRRKGRVGNVKNQDRCTTV